MTGHGSGLLTALALAMTLTAPVRADTIDIAFLPPEVVPQDLCSAGRQDALSDDLDTGASEIDPLARLYLEHLRRDIRNLSAEDADRWFDFILTLIGWQETLDPAFVGNSALLARIALHVDAGRLAELQASGLIEELRLSAGQMTNVQRMALAQYYLNGVGVAADPDYAHGLIREAAFGGNVDALMTIARMQLQDRPLPGWDAPLDLTVTLAFGGMLGQLNAAVCGRAERIAQEYLNGDIVTRNPQIAYAWYRFAADLGGSTAAWRVVEFHLDADAVQKDNDVMLHYLQLAVARGLTLDNQQADRVRSVGNVDEATLQRILGYNFSADSGRERPSLSDFLQLSVNLDGEEAASDGPYLQYLRELTRFETAPGWVFTRLAQEVLILEGRWAGESEAMLLLEQAVQRGDGEGMQVLGRMLVRYRDEPAQMARAISLLTEAVTGHGISAAMADLEALYRCQANEAPLLSEADDWARAYRASMAEPVVISATDLAVLDPFSAPEAIAQIQTQALLGYPQELANQVQRVQLDPFATEDAYRLWAARLNSSDKALELFAELEFNLAANPAERDLAVELFRRIYLNNGVTTALDLSIALVEHNGRDPAIADEIEAMLTQAGNRGEGASIRLLSRLVAGTRTEAEVYGQFAQAIEERGDFLALMFAIPHIGFAQTDDYIDRAVSLMNCGTKDADELGDAYAILQSPDMSYHWRRIGINFEYGHVLAKLALADRQMALFDQGAAPNERQVLERELAEGNAAARRSLYALTADPDLQTWDPDAAAGYLLSLIAEGTAEDEAWVLTSYRVADAAVRDIVDARFDITDLYQRASRRGDVQARLDLALLLRARAAGASDLRAAADWLLQAAEAGSVEAMAELGRTFAFGLGVPVDREAALNWLDQANRAGDTAAGDLARLLRLDTGL